MPSPAISPDLLVRVARQATQDFMERGTSLSQAVVKCASAAGLPFTDEHVRRICEMTYHEAFERVFHSKEGSVDRYVSFDPPDPVWCAKELKSPAVAKTKEASAPPQVSRPVLEQVKQASVQVATPYQPRNAFFEATQVATEKVAERWHAPGREALNLRHMLKTAEDDLSARVQSADQARVHAMLHLVKQAELACKEGTPVAMVLHACTAGAPELSPKIAAAVVDDLVTALAVKGFNTTSVKWASAPEVNPNHPLPNLFAKVASLLDEQLTLAFAYEEVEQDRRRLDRELHKLLHA